MAAGRMRAESLYPWVPPPEQPSWAVWNDPFCPDGFCSASEAGTEKPPYLRRGPQETSAMSRLALMHNISLLRSSTARCTTPRELPLTTHHSPARRAVTLIE